MSIKTNLTLLSTVCFVLLLAACQPPAPGLYKSKDIPSSVGSKLHGVNKDLLDALKRDDREQFENTLSKSMLDDKARMRTAELINIDMKHADYSLINEYYTVSQIDTGKEVIKEKEMGINNFNLTFSREAKEMYIAFFSAKTAVQKMLITAVYDKYDYGWKINHLEFSPYAENGKTAPELVEESQKETQHGYWLDASNTGSYALNCLRPCSYWKYGKEEDIIKNEDKALETVRAHYKLPLAISQVNTHPSIWRVRVERTAEGAFPNINYISTIKLYDTVALKKENEMVGKAIGKVIPGLDKDKKYIYYTIYNEAKKGLVDYRSHYDLKQKLQ